MINPCDSSCTSCTVCSYISPFDSLVIGGRVGPVGPGGLSPAPLSNVGMFGGARYRDDLLFLHVPGPDSTPKNHPLFWGGRLSF